MISCVFGMISGMISGTILITISGIRYIDNIYQGVLNIWYQISGTISYPISLQHRYWCTAGAQEVVQAINHMSLIMIPAIAKGMLMIYTIIWTMILMFLLFLLQILDPTPVSSPTFPMEVIYLKPIIPRHLKLFDSHCQTPYHPVFRFTKQCWQGGQ